MNGNYTEAERAAWECGYSEGVKFVRDYIGNLVHYCTLDQLSRVGRKGTYPQDEIQKMKDDYSKQVELFED